MADEHKMIEDKKQEFQSVFGRMDKDEELYFLKPYKMMGLPPNDNKEIEDVTNVTLNDPLLFATKAIAIIGGATMQTVVEGREMTDKQTTKIEEFLEDYFYLVDERLTKRLVLGLDGFTNEQICMRGRMAARICNRLSKEGELEADVLPIDARYLVYDIGDKGLIWAAATYRRSKAAIEREYGKEIKEDFAEVVDFWDDKQNIVFIETEAIKQQKNIYGYPPFVVSICPIGSNFNTVDAREHYGESIFWANRDLWEEKDRTATILQTLNIQALFGGLQYASSKGEQAAKPQTSPYGPRKIVPVEKDGGYKLMPVNDIKNATRLFYAVLDASLQKGSLSVIDYGTLSFPLSAVAITRLSGSRDDIFLPRIQAKATFYQSMSKMVINQCIALGKTLHLGQPGNQNKYAGNDLKGGYSINYRFFTESKEQDIADLSIANAAQGFLSGDTIRREVLKLKDPDGEETKWLSEQAEKVDEVLFLYRRASKLIEEEKPLEAYILAKRIVTILKQRQLQGAMTDMQAGGKTENQGKDLLPLMTGGRGGNTGQGLTSPTPSEPTETTEVESE
jgi:hypothetical protein